MMKSIPRIALAAALAAALACDAAPALAHPHVFIVAKTDVIFEGGKVAAIRHVWTFDDMYSSFAVQGLAKKGQLATRETFAPLAKENAGSLAETGYYTVLKSNGKQLEFGEVTDYWMEEGADHLVRFSVTLPLKEPVGTGKAMSVQVYDPEYFIDFQFDAKAPPTMVGNPPGCSIGLSKPDAVSVDDSKKLSESFFSGLSPGSGYGLKLASRALVACP